MNQIRNVVIVGMGALGLLFGQRISDSLGSGCLCFLMDEERKARHRSDRYSVNGKPVSFRMAVPAEIHVPADLVILATKAGGLSEARELMRSAVGSNTVIISLLNGISSENILAEVFPREQILDCVAIGMDAVRNGTALTYRNMGKLQIGSVTGSQEARLHALIGFFEQAGIPYEVCGDIRKAMWNKFMINVGINQTCMVYRTSYGGATAPGSKAFDDMSAAMHEVIAVAAAEGIRLTEEDYEKDIVLLRSLDPEGCPSMRQDAMAGRPSEVDLFAGTVLDLARRHGIEVPVNARYYRTIREMESLKS